MLGGQGGPQIDILRKLLLQQQQTGRLPVDALVNYQNSQRRIGPGQPRPNFGFSGAQQPNPFEGGPGLMQGGPRFAPGGGQHQQFMPPQNFYDEDNASVPNELNFRPSPLVNPQAQPDQRKATFNKLAQFMQRNRYAE